MDASERITLFSLDTRDIKVTVEAYFDTDGNLVVEGYDIGSKVQECWGDSDYEYSTAVIPEETTKLYVLFNLREGIERGQLLKVIQQRFNSNTCFSDFRKYLEENKIRYKGFSWT